MIYQTIPIGRRAKLYAYIPDSEIGYGVHRTWPAMVILPGGGYLISATKEGEGAALPFLAQGFACFVLRYSTYVLDRESFAAGHPNVDEAAHYPTQQIELLEALHIIHMHAKEWMIDEQHIYLNGYSAGGHIAASAALRYRDPAYTARLSFVPEPDELKVQGLILCYPMLTGRMGEYLYAKRNEPGNILWQVPFIMDCLFGTEHPSEEQLEELDLVRYVDANAPACFLWQTGGDVVLDPTAATAFVSALQRHGVPCEYHLFMNGPHGLCMADDPYAKNEAERDTDAAQWFPLVCNWLKHFE